MVTRSHLAWAPLVASLLILTSVVAQEQEKVPSAKPAGEPESSPSRQQRAEDLAVLAKVAGGYTVKLEQGEVAEFNPEPAFRWSNSVAATIGRHVKDAGVFFWMFDGRPVAMTSVVWYPQAGLYQEFQSLASEPITATHGDKQVWEPRQPGIKFAPLPNAPQPAATEAKRLSQMKTLAGRFRAEVIKGPPSFPEGSVWQLRLLPRQLVRYGGPENLARDGAVFAFCQDTDPDVFLMLEVRGEGEKLAWHYAMGPLTSREAKGWYEDKVVWSKPLIQPPKDPKRPYFVIGPTPVPEKK